MGGLLDSGELTMGNLKSGMCPVPFLGDEAPVMGVLGVVEERPMVPREGANGWVLLNRGEACVPPKGRRGSAADCGPAKTPPPRGDICRLVERPWPRAGRRWPLLLALPLPLAAPWPCPLLWGPSSAGAGEPIETMERERWWVWLGRVGGGGCGCGCGCGGIHWVVRALVVAGTFNERVDR